MHLGIRQPKRAAALLAAVAALTVPGTSQAIGARGEGPQRPAWVNENGQVNPELRPDRMPLLDEHGEVIGEADVPDAPPPVHPSEMKELNRERAFVEEDMNVQFTPEEVQ